MAYPISWLGFQVWGEKIIQSPCSFFLMLPWRQQTDVLISMENSMQLNTIMYYAELMCNQPHAKAPSYYPQCSYLHIQDCWIRSLVWILASYFLTSACQDQNGILVLEATRKIVMQEGFKKLKLKIGRDRKRMSKTTGKSKIQNRRAEKEDFKFTTKILNIEFSF